MRIETGAPNQRPVDLRLAKKRLGIFRLHATAVKDAHRIGHGSADHACYLAADNEMSLCGHVGCSRLSRSNGPDWLISNHHRVQSGGIDLVNGAADLLAHNLCCLASLPLLLVLPDADNRYQAMLEGSHELAVDRVVGLAKVLAPLRMAKDHVADTQSH
jgi:hypothetical protein